MDLATHQPVLGRYEILGQLGEGGYGVVYEARERATGERVALKELVHVNGATLARFKQEFRAVQEVHHPNLVRLDALFEDEGKWVIAMELVEGEDLLAHVYDEHSALCFDEQRLRDVFGQLADALSALHAAGFVHRDLKPSNVRVTKDGRVVLLDFGLTTALEPSAQSTLAAGLGTIAYMAPEQASSRKVDAAVDWYAFGVCLYEALTGVLPIEADSPIALLRAKEQPLAQRPRELVPLVPEDLDELCVGLLAVVPEARPAAKQVRSVLAGEAGTRPSAPSGAPAASAFEGRELELQALESVFTEVSAGSCQVVLVEGESGIGKSALVQRFLAAREGQDRGALVLRSRCYENELLAYKAFDGAVDGLTRTLARLGAAEALALLPPRAGLLCRLFPALASVPALARSGLAGVAADPGVQRLEAFALFGRLLAALSATQPIVLAIDDLQWADAESFRLLHALLGQQPAPRCMVLATVRPRAELDAETGEAIDALRNLHRVSTVALRGLPHDNARMLARELLGPEIPESWLEIIVKESAGHPLFLTVLTRFAGSEHAKDAAELTLDAAIGARIGNLSPHGRALLEAVALLGSPQTAPMCGRAAGLNENETARLIAELCAQKLLRRRRAGEIACFHDHIRRVAVQSLPPPQQKTLHAQIASALETRSSSDPTELARHYEAAGETARAFDAYRRAAERAEPTLAFDRVAALYARALDAAAALDLEPAKRTALMVARGHALARGGRSAEAARLYLEAAEVSAGEDQTRLRIWAAQHLLQSGRLQEGMAAARALLEELGVPLPTSTAGTYARLLWDRAYLGLRGLEAKATVPTDLRVRMQLDALWGLSMPVTWLDPLASAALTTRHLRLARDVGEPAHMARALAEEAFARTIQKPDDAEADVLLARARALCDRSKDPALEVSIAFREATVANFRWDLPRSRERLEHAQRYGTEHCPAEPWLLTNVRTALGTAWTNMGEFSQVAACTTAWIAEARDRNDQFALTMLEGVGFGFIRHLMADEPDQARSAIAAVIAPWPSDPFSFAHFGELVSVFYTECYRGGDTAHLWIERERARLSRAFVLKMGFGKACFLMFRSLACLRARVDERGTQADQRGRELRGYVRKLREVDSPLAEINAVALEAQLLALERDTERALRKAQWAHATSLRCGGLLHGASLEYLAGVLEGGSAGREKRTAALDFFARHGWKDPRRAVAMLCPALDALER